jgi:hypothetical protein
MRLLLLLIHDIKIIILSHSRDVDDLNLNRFPQLFSFHHSMNSVYVPVHVVVLLRRIVNVISSLSISNQYLLLKQAKADEERAWADARAKSPLSAGVAAKPPSQRALDDVKSVEWPWWAFRDRWEWPRLIIVDKVAVGQKRRHNSPSQGALQGIRLYVVSDRPPCLSFVFLWSDRYLFAMDWKELDMALPAVDICVL